MEKAQKAGIFVALVTVLTVLGRSWVKTGKVDDKPVKQYIRFGDIPTDQLSTIHYRGFEVGKEPGVSVYDCICNDKGEYQIVLPTPCSEGTITSLQGLMFYSKDKNIYLVTGDFVGYGTDGEPCITNVQVLEDITEKFRKDNYVDEDAKHEKLISGIKKK